MRVEEVVGRRIREIRDSQGMTQEQLGQAIGELLGKPWPRQTVSSAEAGRRAFTAVELMAVAHALRVYVGSLFTPPQSGVELSPGVQIAYSDVLGHHPDLQLAPPGEVDPDAVEAQLAEIGARLQEAEQRRQEAHRKLDEIVSEQSATELELEQSAMDVAWLQALLSTQRAMRPLARDPGRVPIKSKENALQPVVAAIVTSELGVLVGQRNDGKPPWTFIAGEVEPRESPADAAVREVKEETGLEVEAGQVIGERVHPKTGRTMIYMAARPVRGTDVFVGDSEELAEVRWVSLAELDNLMGAGNVFAPVHEHLARELGED